MTARPVEQSLFPDIAPDRPRGPIPGSVQTGTNADLIAAIAPLYLHGRTVLDVTYGEGKWWTRYQSPEFTAHDLHKLDGVDFRHLPEPDYSVDVVCFDPPYVTSGGAATNDSAAGFRDRFGIDRVTGYGHENDLVELIVSGLAECVRVARCFVLVKCMEFVSSRSFHDMPSTIRGAACGLGLDVHDVIVHHTGAGPGGHNIWSPIRARRHHSYLIVFAVPQETPRV